MRLPARRWLTVSRALVPRAPWREEGQRRRGNRVAVCLICANRLAGAACCAAQHAAARGSELPAPVYTNASRWSPGGTDQQLTN